MQTFTKNQIKKLDYVGIDKSAFQAYYAYYLEQTNNGEIATFDEFLDNRIRKIQQFPT